MRRMMSPGKKKPVLTETMMKIKVPMVIRPAAKTWRILLSLGIEPPI